MAYFSQRYLSVHASSTFGCRARPRGEAPHHGLSMTALACQAPRKPLIFGGVDAEPALGNNDRCYCAQFAKSRGVGSNGEVRGIPWDQSDVGD